MEQGKFITLEGIEGAGKSTQMATAQNLLKNHGKKVLSTREPGGTPLGEALRALLLENATLDIHQDAELLLMFAARAQHVKQVIEPALQKGYWVICDRFTDASYAYQGGGRGIAVERIRLLENWVQGTLRPNLTLLFDLPVQQGLARAGRSHKTDRFETETEHFFAQVRNTYLQIAHSQPHRYRIIDASSSKEIVAAEVETILSEFVNG
jgi:dTMP kinase